MLKHRDYAHSRMAKREVDSFAAASSVPSTRATMSTTMTVAGSPSTKKTEAAPRLQPGVSSRTSLSWLSFGARGAAKPADESQPLRS